LTVDDPGHHPLARRIVLLACERRDAAAHQGDFPVRHRHVAVLDDSVREHQIAGHDEIKVRH